VDAISLPERPSGITEGEVDAVALLDEMVEVLGFAGERLLQQAEEVFARRPFVVISELDMVPPAGGGILDYPKCSEWG
jgi:hypothetical protein